MTFQWTEEDLKSLDRIQRRYESKLRTAIKNMRTELQPDAYILVRFKLEDRKRKGQHQLFVLADDLHESYGDYSEAGKLAGQAYKEVTDALYRWSERYNATGQISDPFAPDQLESDEKAAEMLKKALQSRRKVLRGYWAELRSQAA